MYRSSCVPNHLHGLHPSGENAGIRSPSSKMQCKAKLSEGFVRTVQYCNRFNFPGSSKKFCVPFMVDGRQVGLIRPDVLVYLKDYPDVFCMKNHHETDELQRVELSLELQTFDERTAKVDRILQELRQKEVFVTLDGWRDECYDVRTSFAEPPLMKMERAATCLFGIHQYGVHINGYTRSKTEGLSIWVGKRSATKPTFPGKLDQMAAGGIASGDTVMQCGQSECQEEASVPDELLKRLKPAGCTSYFYEDERGLYPETQFVMDLELPVDFVPVSADGEQESFELVPIEKLKELIIKDRFKYDSAICNLDFLVRHGLIMPDEEPNYEYLVEMMHASISWP